MTYFLLVLLGFSLVAGGVFAAMWWSETGRKLKLKNEAAAQVAAAWKQNEESQEKAAQLVASVRSEVVDAEKRNEELRSRIAQLAAWQAVGDAEMQAQRIMMNAKGVLTQAESDARVLTNNAEARANEILTESKESAAKTQADARARAHEAEEWAKAAIDMAEREARAKVLEGLARVEQGKEEAQRIVDSASVRGRMIVDEAQKKANEVAGEALEAVQNAAFYRRTAEAMRNTIKGYGDEYLVPPSSFLDSLAEQFSHKDAGQELKLARARTRQFVKDERAATCDYVEASRREGAANFVLDAFNGKVDSTLSKVKDDNGGKLEQEIRDAFQMVNFGGKPFRDARITEEYLNARLQELRWAVIAQLLRKEEAEEQRRIREKMRDEERARREYEREIRESAKEEDMLRKAMAKAEARIAEASAEEKAKFQVQLAELQQRVVEAEQRNQRAISMAQQTKRGNIYIISNVGSFGENVYKIGMTRRLDPMDRIWELGDSSVPFDFDVHAFITCDDAPALECRLHHHFVLNQVNKVNYRKEFFRAGIADIRREIEALGITASWTMASEAREYRESLAIEKKIAEDPAAREAWINGQLCLDPTDFVEAELVEAGEEDE